MNSTWIPFTVTSAETGAYIPMDRWGQDHWSTLVYFETLTVDRKGLINNAQMRCDARIHRHFVIMTRFGSEASQGKYPTRLKDGVEQANHDDWSCLEDMIAAGLVNGWFRQMNEETFGNSQAYVELTELGRALSQQLRAHKASGETYATFVPQLDVEVIR